MPMPDTPALESVPAPVPPTVPTRGTDPLRHRIDFGLTAGDLGPRQPEEALSPRRVLRIPWPDGWAPRPTALPVEPGTEHPLPHADVLVVTWTAAEMLALADVLTPGVNPRTGWYRTTRGFDRLLPQIRSGAPARVARRLGSYYPTRVGDRSVLCLKSELHLNQDGVRTGDGTATLPVADWLTGVLAEVQPSLVLTVGTSGATYAEHGLGDVVITRGARFLLESELAKEPFADACYRSSASLPTRRLATATDLMRQFAPQLAEPDFGPPTKQYPGSGAIVPGPHNQPAIHVDGVDLNAFDPIISTDAFVFGTSANRMDRTGCAVEMGDAVFGLVAQRSGPGAVPWLAVRNLSNPAVNGDLPTDPIDMQAHWSSWYYEQYGYWTSVNGAIATWAVIAD